MAKIGYLPYLPQYAGGTDDRQWMADFGCEDIVEEQPVEGGYRLGWDRLLAAIGKGDTLVISKLAHVVKGARQLSFFLEFCRIKSVRLISLHDGIDSDNELFPETKVSDVLNMVARLPEEANVEHGGQAARRSERCAQDGFPSGKADKRDKGAFTGCIRSVGKEETGGKHVQKRLYHRGYMESQRLPKPQFHLPCIEGCRSGTETLPKQSERG